MPKQVDHDAYRLELLTKCFELFARRGYGNVSMRQIAKALDVSTGTLYHYFSGKKAIFKQMFLTLSEQEMREVEAMAASQDGASLDERLDILFRFVHENAANSLSFLFLTLDFYQRRGRLESDDFIKQAAANFQRTIMTLGGLPAELATFVASFIDGVMLQKSLAEDRVDLDVQFGILRQTIIAYMQMEET